MYDERRYNSEMTTAKRMGLEEGITIGVEQGFQQGLQQGVERGKIETARELKALGIDLETIAKCTGIDIDKIPSL